MASVYVNEEYLRINGFVKDTTCPVGVNRWEKIDRKVSIPYWISVTLTDDGVYSKYGVLNFHSSSDNHILEHRSFECAITVEDFEKFASDGTLYSDLPKCVKTTRR